MGIRYRSYGMLGKKHKESSKNKLRETIKKKMQKNEWYIPSMKGRKNPNSPLKRLNKDPEFIKKKLKGLIRRPNKPEQKLINIFKENNIPFKYVGDGSVLIGYKNPDFICNPSKKIIELFGFYHTKPNFWHQTEEGCKKYYANYGFKTLVIWVQELQNQNLLLNKIRKFMQDG